MKQMIYEWAWNMEPIYEQTLFLYSLISSLFNLPHWCCVMYDVMQHVLKLQ